MPAFEDALRAALDRLVGTWRTTGRMLDGSADDGETWTGWDEYEWFPGGGHMVHRVDVEMAGRRREAIEVFSPRVGSVDTFDQTSFDADGTVDHAVGRFDDRGRYLNDAGEIRATVVFDAGDAMHADWQMRRSDGAWAPWMHLEFHRVGDPHIEVRSKTDHAG